jgi:ERCC4-type nuclease
VATVPTGADYSIDGFEGEIGIERKSLDDLVGSLTVGRERFARSLAALSTRRWRAVVVEGSLADLLAGRYLSRANPSSMLGSICSICADGVPVLFADDAGGAAALAERLLCNFWKRALAARQVEAA